MKHSRSSAEWEIRDALVAFLHEELPKARIVHEMNVDNGMHRADVTAVLPDRLFIFEIKSERDKLTSLEGQMKAFRACSHQSVLVAHEKWFDRTPWPNGEPRLSFPHDYGRFIAWCHPEPQPRGIYTQHCWQIPDQWRLGLGQPHAHRLLNLLWRGELIALADRLAVPGVKARLTMDAVIQMIVWHSTGRQIAEGVCRALRSREFAEADAPIEVAA